MWMLAATLRRNVRHRAFDDLEERLLHPFARNVARDRWVVGLAGDLVDLVDIDDAALRALNVAIGRLDQAEQDVLNVFTNIASLGQARGIGNAERHVKESGERLRKERLAGTGRSNKEDVRLGDLHTIGNVRCANALIVVVHANGERALGALLADDMLVECRMDHARGWRNAAKRLALRRRWGLLGGDFGAEGNALVADVDALTGDQLANLLLRLAAEGAAIGSRARTAWAARLTASRLSGSCSSAHAARLTSP